jgi:hypothetical protein
MNPEFTDRKRKYNIKLINLLIFLEKLQEI